MSGIIEKLQELREYGGSRRTLGLSDERIAQFANDVQLLAAVDRAVEAHRALRDEWSEVLQLDERVAVEAVGNRRARDERAVLREDLPRGLGACRHQAISSSISSGSSRKCFTRCAKSAPSWPSMTR